MPENLIVPLAIETVIQNFETAQSAFTELDVQQALGKARGSLENPSPAENLGAWAELLAFALVGGALRNSPWGTFFGPIGSGTREDGTPFYSPDIDGTPPEVIPHWSDRATKLTHPVLKARYADLAWEMCTVIAKARRDPEMARIAIDAYIASMPKLAEPHDQFQAVIRALDLATLIHDANRSEAAKLALMALHRGAVAKRGLWWKAFDRLIDDKLADVTAAERQELVTDLEALVTRFADVAKPESFDPHATKQAAERLIRYYTRLGQIEDVKRLHKTIAQTFEHFASLGAPMLAAAVLQTAVKGYRDAGLPQENQRARILMEDKIGQARDQMKPVGTEFTIPRADIDKFAEAVVVDDLASTFARIAAEFLPRRTELESQVQKTLQDAPLMAHIPLEIMADDHVAAKIGSVQDDPFGRLLHQTDMHFGLSAIWLQEALNRTMQRHEPVPEHFVGWANRHGVFDDVTFLLEGATAWYEGDLVKAVHVLVPQIENGLRSIVGQLGKPLTKPHPKVQGASVAINIGDFLYAQEIAEALGPDLILYFLALYADPRGKNLRNRVAHGLIKAHLIDPSLARWLIHTLLVLGVWKELAKSRR
jgi:lysyl-tRNA synthetase class 1